MRRFTILTTALVAACLVGCGGSGKDDLVVSAATSLKTAFTGLGGAKYSFAGSDELAAQIQQGAKVDVFASANTSLPDQLYKKGIVEKPKVFAGNRLVLAVPADHAKVKRLSDIYKGGIKLAVGSNTVPIGAYTREVLGKLPPADAQAALGNVRSNEPDVGGIVGKLTQGAVDAGFVYITDVEATKGQLKAIELPRKISPEVAYGVAVVKDSKHQAAAKKFVNALVKGDGKDELKKAGFSFPNGV